MLGMLSDEKHLDTKINLKDSTEEELEKEVRNICNTVINEDPKEITILVGGVTNALYKCDFEARKPILIRINGEGTEKIIDRKKEIAKMRQVTLKLNTGIIRGAFANGLVYDYIPGEPLGPEMVPKHMDGIASAMAIFHKLEIETEDDKAPMLFNTMASWLEETKDINFEDEVRAQRLKDINIPGRVIPAIEGLKERMKHFKVAFCHNDLLGANIIYNAETGKYNFIDHEYGDYNYIAFDIGDHFVEWCGLETFVAENYPTAENQRNFVRYYLKAYNNGEEPTEKDIDILVAKANVGGLASNLFWGVWAIFQAANSKIKFNYLEYAKTRVNMYMKLAKKFLEEYDQVKEKYNLP